MDVMSGLRLGLDSLKNSDNLLPTMKRRVKKSNQRKYLLWWKYVETMTEIENRRNNVQPQVENPLTK